jgi:putative transposase
MARLPRLDLPHIPQHIVQRGNNRLPCFLDDADRRRYPPETAETGSGSL